MAEMSSPYINHPPLLASPEQLALNRLTLPLQTSVQHINLHNNAYRTTLKFMTSTHMSLCTMLLSAALLLLLSALAKSQQSELLQPQSDWKECVQLWPRDNESHLMIKAAVCHD